MTQRLDYQSAAPQGCAATLALGQMTTHAHKG